MPLLEDVAVIFF